MTHKNQILSNQNLYILLDDLQSSDQSIYTLVTL